MTSSFSERLAQQVQRCGAPGCVGLDPHLSRLPPHLRVRFEGLVGDAFRAAAADAVQEWSLGVVGALAGVVPIIKPQAGFYEALGWRGQRALEATCAAARDVGLLVLLDAKRGDIGSTAEAYAMASIDSAGPCAADAVTLSPYLGAESLSPFLARCDSQGRGVFVLVRTSNPGSERWQCGGPAEAVADQLEAWNAERIGDSGFGPVGAVIAANLPDELVGWRKRMPHTWFLMPGFGAQGATADDVKCVIGPGGLGALVSASRSVLFPDAGRVDADWQGAVARRARAFMEELPAIC